MKRLALLLLLPALALAGEFVTNPATTLPGPKTDSRNLPAGSDPNKFLRSSDFNALRDAANDLRDYVRAPNDAQVTSTGGTTARALRDRFADVVNVKDFGAKGDGVTDDTAAVTAARQASASNGAVLFFPPGHYVLDSSALDFGAHSGFRIIGSGADDTFLHARTPDHGIEITGGYFHHGEIGHMTIVGYGKSDPTPNKHGIYIHDNGPYGGPNDVRLHDLIIRDFSGHGVYLVENWQTTIENVTVNSCADHLFDIRGGITTALIGTYAQTVATGKAGYRVHAGNPTFVAANGINNSPGIPEQAGAFWGIFGDDVADGDAANAYVKATLIGCNVEDFTAVGIRLKTGSGLNLVSTSFLAPDTGSGYKAIVHDSPGFSGTLDALTRFDGATYADALPIHVAVGGAKPPFVTLGVEPLNYRIDALSATYPLPAMTPRSVGFHNTAMDFPRVQTASLVLKAIEPAFTTPYSPPHQTASVFVLTPADGSAFTISNPPDDPGATAGQRITIRIKNTTAGTLGTVTWGSYYKLAAWTQPAAGFSRSITFEFASGNKWIEVSRTPADVPN